MHQTHINVMPTTQQAQPRKSSFYRRPLPSPSVAFSSPEGRVLFREALEANTVESYWCLAEQFCTQDEPAYCGVSTLVMVLNALKVDPRRTWKGAWRWYTENMLDCCVPLELVQQSGITLPQFSCLARCQGVDVKMVRAQNSSEDEFRRVVRAVCSGSQDGFLVVSYSRQIVSQTGTGHFSPIAAFHEASDMVLVLDVARFKYPPHWIPLPLMFQAMVEQDPATEMSRGYVLLKQIGSSSALLTLGGADNKPSEQDLQALQQWWANAKSISYDPSLTHQVFQFVQELPRSIELFGTFQHHRCVSCLEASHAKLLQELVGALERHPVFQLVRNAMIEIPECSNPVTTHQPPGSPICSSCGHKNLRRKDAQKNTVVPPQPKAEPPPVAATSECAKTTTHKPCVVVGNEHIYTLLFLAATSSNGVCTSCDPTGTPACYDQPKSMHSGPPSPTFSTSSRSSNTSCHHSHVVGISEKEHGSCSNCGGKNEVCRGLGVEALVNEVFHLRRMLDGIEEL